MSLSLGIDVGSVTTKMSVIDDENVVMASLCRRTEGRPMLAVQAGLREIGSALRSGGAIESVGTTGSARHLAAALVGADLAKNEITAHAMAAILHVPSARTILEIGGQDSKLILLEDGVVTDFAMNSVCAAGTGSFLDQQAHRLGIPIEDFGGRALESQTPVRIAGRCTVFAESDMIHKQQMGHAVEDIMYGLCLGLARNFLNNLGQGKTVLPTVVFQGGVAANVGMRRAFEEILGLPIFVPPHHAVMGAIGAALLARDHVRTHARPTSFKGFAVAELACRTTSFVCEGCANMCEIVEVIVEGETLARWGSRCGKWDV